MARDVPDLALLLSVMAGPDARDAQSLPEQGSSFRELGERDFRGVRIAWSENLNCYPVEPAVTAVCNGARSAFVDLGCDVRDAEPNLSGVDELSQTLRAHG
jgi:amidase